MVVGGGDKMWYLEIKCVATVVACLTGGVSTPTGVEAGLEGVSLFHPTRVECERVALHVAKMWKPGEGAWTFRCVLRPDRGAV